MLSYWEKSVLKHYDLAVIGGGITGLFCALEFRKKNPSARIAVFEKGLFPDGASTKNAGFACFGSLTELIEDEQKMGVDGVLELVQKRIKGLEKLRQTLGDSAMDFQLHGGYELFTAHPFPHDEALEKFNCLLKPIFNENVYHVDNQAINRFGFSKKHLTHMVKNAFEGQINTGMMMDALMRKAREANIISYTQTTITDIEMEPHQNHFTVKHGEKSTRFSAKLLAVCNNAFAKSLRPGLELQPGRGMILLTKPMPDLKIKGCFHYEAGYYYFRNLNNRILFGGGRSLDLKGETTTEHGINPLIRKKLLKDLKTFILPGINSKIDMEWSGIMGFGKNKKPLIQNIGPNAVMGVRLGGMGVAIGSMVGKETCDLLD